MPEPKAPRRRPADGITETVPKPKAPRRRLTKDPTVITETVLGRARVSRRRRSAEGGASPVDLWAQALEPAKPPPGVVPNGAKTLAQDEAIGPLTSWGGNYRGILGSQYAEGMIWPGYAELSLFAQRGENRMVSEELASEMTRSWITLKSASDEDKSEKINEINKELDRLKVRQVIRQALEHDFFFGRGHIYFDCCDPDDRDELKSSIGDGTGALSRLKISPKNPVKALRAVEPVWTYPTQYNSENPLRADWYRPESWFVMGREVSRTRLLTIIGREVPDMLKPAYSFGGLSMSQMIKPDVDNWLRTRQSVADLIRAFSIFVLKTDLGVTMQMGGDQLFKRVELFNLLRDNNDLMVLNSKTEEEFQNVSAPLGTLDHLQAQAQEHIAAKAGIPLIKLLKITPTGLNASSEFELEAYYDAIMGRLEKMLRDPIRTIICFSQLNLYGEVDDDITFDFNPLKQLSEKETAELDQLKQQTDSGYIQDSVVSPDEVRVRLANDRDSPYLGLDLDKSPAPQPPDPFGGEMPGGLGEGSKTGPQSGGAAEEVRNAWPEKPEPRREAA